MPHHCPFPVRSTDSRCSYRTGSVPGFALVLALVAALLGYACISHAAPAGAPGGGFSATPPSAADALVDRQAADANGSLFDRSWSARNGAKKSPGVTVRAWDSAGKVTSNTRAAYRKEL